MGNQVKYEGEDEMIGNNAKEVTRIDIIIVDNNQDNSGILSHILTTEKYTYIVADHCDKVSQLIQDHAPKLVLLNMMTPDSKSFDTCRQMKVHENTRHLPVIFFGKPDDKASIMKAYEAGANDFISIPFSEGETIARINNQLGIYKERLKSRVQNNNVEVDLSKYNNTDKLTDKAVIGSVDVLDDSVIPALDELFNLNDLQKLQDKFADAFGIASIITTPAGVPITKASNFTYLCQNLIRQTSKGLKNCMYSDAIIGCHNPKGPTVMPCLSGGLMDAGASITVGGKHVANWLIGQIRSEETNEEKLREYAREIGVNEADFMQAWSEVKSMPREQFQKIAEMLFTMADQLSVISWQNVQKSHYIQRKQKAEEALFESEKRFSTILYSIGDGVITTDTQGRIKIMNPVAESLTGWTQTEASGKLLEEVFRIVNEETRATVEIPVRKVLREGVTVGLANHTLLISKDGTEYPIADSGAPIRTEQGEIVGVVLIFRDQSVERNAEAALRESEKRFKLLYENAPLSYQSLDPQASLIDVNPTWLNVMGYSREEVIGRFFGDFMTAESAEMIKTRFPHFVSTGEIHDYQFEMVKKDGSRFLVSYDGKIGYDELGHFKSTHCIFTDITQRKQSEDALKESEYRFRSLFENSSVGISVTTIDGVIKVNKAFADMLGYLIEELKNLNWRNITYPDDIQRNEEILNSLLKGDSSSSKFEKRYIHKDGHILWGDISITLQRDSNNEPAYYITSINDITKRKLAEQALRESEERYQAFVNANSDMIFVKDDQFRYLMANDAMAAFFGKTKEELYGKTDAELADINHIAPCASSDLKVINSNKTITTEEKLGDRIFESTKFPLQLSANKNGVGGILRDITENKISDERIKNERQLLRTVIDNLPVTIYVKDRDGRKIIANPADLKVIGAKSEDDVLGKTDLDTFSGEIGLRGYEDDLKVIHSGQPVINREEAFLNEEGNQQWLLTSKIPLRDQQGNIIGLVGIGRDITEQKKANETILKFSKSIEQSPSTIVITDVHGNIEYANPTFTEVTGYTLDEVIGQNPRILKSGEMDPRVYKELWQTISSGEVWRGEFLNRRKNGELFWEWATMTSIKNEEGITTNYISIKEDISSRKKMEADLIVAKNKAEENDRLKSAFLANMSHEIRTPLNSIIGFSEILSDPEFESDQRYEYARIITNSGNNLLSIISDILDISKIEAGQVEIRKSIFSVKKLINDIHNEYKMKADAKGVELIVPQSFPLEEILIESDETKVRQVLINFVGNALKFTEKGRIEIEMKLAGRSLHLLVKDTGIGIPQQYHARIFERFRQVEGSYTRKYGGNGLGLAISKSLIEMLGGSIGMQSKEGEGSLFYFELPDVLV